MDDIKNFIANLHGPILVTGASGFVGANLFKQLLAQRQDVKGIVRTEKGWRLQDIANEQILHFDMTDAAALKNLVHTLKPQTVFDCAAYGAYSFEAQTPLIYRTNVQALVDFVHLLAEQGVHAYVHAGSSSEYGENSAAPDESAICKPNSHYSVSKLAAAEFLHYMGRSCNFPCLNLRLYSIYGELEDTSRLIPTLLKSASHGTLPPLVDARTSRDFVYVKDVCNAFILAAAKMNPALYGASLNIGSGNKTTIADLVVTTKNLFAVDAQPQFGTMTDRAWDLPDWYANPARAQAALGWRSQVTLAEGLRKTMSWVQSLSDQDMKLTSKINQQGRTGSISAIIACYKDAQAIPFMHQRLCTTFQKLGIDYEIIFVNDGSPDNSAEVIRELSAKDPRVLGITHSRNFGSQMAFRSGMELSTKESVVLLDGDLQDPPELIEQFHAHWRAGSDVVYGRRVKRDMPWAWGLLYKLFYRVFAAFSYVKIPLDAGDFSLMDKRVVGWLLSCPERDLFMRGLRAYVGFKQTGVDYARPERMFGVSTNNLIKNIDWAKKGIFSFSNAPLTMLTTAGVVLLIISLLVVLIVVTLRVVAPDIAPRGVTTLLISILFFGSLNLFAIGLVGEYIAKIMAEVKARPAFIRSALIRNGYENSLQSNGLHNQLK